MQILTIIVIGLVALAVQFMFERRRTRTAREFEAKRLAAEKQYWASRHLAEVTSSAAKNLAEAQQKAQLDKLTSESARQKEVAASLQQRRAFDPARAKPRPTARYHVEYDEWQDRDNNPIVTPPRHLIDKDGFYYGETTPKPRAGLSTKPLGSMSQPELNQFNREMQARVEEDEQAKRRRQAVDAAMVDAHTSGLGVVRTSYDDSGPKVEHVPVASVYRGGGGSFDGGGASGDYSASTCSSSSSSSSSDSGSSSSCSSSDSGGGSSSSD